MYLTVNDVENVKEFHNDILICEYYPKSSYTQNGVVYPVMYSQIHNGYIPVEVFNKMLSVYNDCGNNYSYEKNSDALYTFDEYKNCIDNLINLLTNAHRGRFRFRSKDVGEMYNHYKKIYQSGMWVAGVVNMVADNALATADELLPIIPSEGFMTVLGFNTYVKRVSELVPNLNMDLQTALYLYKSYRSETGVVTGDGEEIPFILNNDLQTISNIVSQLTQNISATDIDEMLADNISDSSLVGYYQYMLSNYGVREKVAKALLAYRDHRLQKTIYNIVVRNAKIDTARELVIFPKVSYVDGDNSVSMVRKTLF